MKKIARTQKAIGILKGLPSLFKADSSIAHYFDIPQHDLIRNKKDLNDFYHSVAIDSGATSKISPVFARPCPIKPRHGFVDSRIITTKNQLLNLMNEVLKQDKQGELLIGEYFEKVDYNSILVSSGTLSVGKGNDGATAGTNSVSFSVTPYNVLPNIKKNARISKKDSVYFEAININSQVEGNYDSDRDDFDWKMVQMRGGPATNVASGDFIPKNIKVKKVIVPNENLLAWEKEVANLSQGIVVYGNGHTLASHAAIHCILHGIPFITTFEPKINDKLKKNSNKKRNLNVEQFKKGVSVALTLNDFNYKKLFMFSLAVLHNWAYLRNCESADFILGAAATTFAKLGAALCYGENRHSMHNVPHRHEVYNNVINNGKKYLNDINKVFDNFVYKDWSEGFGGFPWANCTIKIRQIWKEITEICNSKKEEIDNKNIVDMVDTINCTVNLVHNNGWWFNKISQTKDLDFAVKNPSMCVLYVSDIFYDVANRVNKLKKIEKIATLKDLKTPLSTDNKGKFVAAFVEKDYYDSESSYLYLWKEGMREQHIKNVPTRNIRGMNKKDKLFLKGVPGKGFVNPNDNKLIYPYKSIRTS